MHYIFNYNFHIKILNLIKNNDFAFQNVIFFLKASEKFYLSEFYKYFIIYLIQIIEFLLKKKKLRIKEMRI